MTSNNNGEQNKSECESLVQGHTVIRNRKNDEKNHTQQLIEYLASKEITLRFVENSNNSVVSSLIFPKKGKRSLSRQQSGIVVKEIKHKLDGSHSEQCEDLRNEVRHLKKLDHSHILKMHDGQIFEFSASCAIFLPQAKCDLFDYLIKYTQEDNLTSIKISFRQIAKALQYIHQEHALIHGDIKPDNIFVFGKRDYRLADFGFCRKAHHYTTHSEFLKVYSARSLKYLPPEITEALERSDFNLNIIDDYSTDVFGLGISLFQVIFKQCPFDQSQEFFCLERPTTLVSSPQTERPLIKVLNVSAMKTVIRNPKNINTTLSPQSPQSILMSPPTKQTIIRSPLLTTPISPILPNNNIESISSSTSSSQSPPNIPHPKQAQNKRKYYHKEDAIYKLLYYPYDLLLFWNHYKDDLNDLFRISDISTHELASLKDLIQRSITPFQYLRISIDDFLNHPFLSEQSTQQSYSP